MPAFQFQTVTQELIKKMKKLKNPTHNKKCILDLAKASILAQLKEKREDGKINLSDRVKCEFYPSCVNQIKS